MKALRHLNVHGIFQIESLFMEKIFYFFTALSHWALPGGEGSWQQWTFDQVIQQTFTPTSVGQEFGPTWTTHWFKVIDIPIEEHEIHEIFPKS